MEKKLFTKDFIKTSIDNDDIWLFIGLLISADVVIDLKSAEKSLNLIKELQECVSSIDFETETYKDKAFGDKLQSKISDCVQLLENEIKQYGKEE